MSRLRVIQTGQPQVPGGRTSPEKRDRPAPWRRLTSRYWRCQIAVAEHPAFEPLRSRRVRRLLVVAFAASTMVCLGVFWTQGLWSGWLHYLTASVVVVLDLTIIVAAQGVTALPERELDERQLRQHRRLLTRAFWAVLWVILAIALVLPKLIDKGVIRPLDGGQVFALLWGVALLGGMTGVCLEAWATTSDAE